MNPSAAAGVAGDETFRPAEGKELPEDLGALDVLAAADPELLWPLVERRRQSCGCRVTLKAARYAGSRSDISTPTVTRTRRE